MNNRINLAIGESIERLALFLHSLHGTNLRENLINMEELQQKKRKRKKKVRTKKGYFSETFFFSFAAIWAR